MCVEDAHMLPRASFNNQKLNQNKNLSKVVVRCSLIQITLILKDALRQIWKSPYVFKFI